MLICASLNSRENPPNIYASFGVLNCGLTTNLRFDGVWGGDLIVNDRSVDRCVTTLRAKIEMDPRHPRHIQTIRDTGYRFEST